MPKLLQYVRPFIPTVPNLWQKVHTSNIDLGTFSLPTSGSSSFTYDMSLPFRLRKGYIMMLSFSFSRSGGWSGKRWTGSFVIDWLDLTCTDYTFPECYRLISPLELRDGGPVSYAYGLRIYGIGQESMRLRFSFSLDSRVGDPPYNISIVATRVIHKPDTFTNWVP